MVRNLFSQLGFSLIEMLVSLALFSVVVTVSVGALLVLVSSNEQLQDEQSVLTNLSFALDSMTREIRTGTNYYCDSQNSEGGGESGAHLFQNESTLEPDLVKDCYAGNHLGRNFHGLSFIESGQSITESSNTRIVYFFDASQGKIMRRVSGQSAQPVTSSGIYIKNAEFFVTGTERLSVSGDLTQPSVTIFVEAQESDSSTAKSYRIQTTVTQRTLDI